MTKRFASLRRLVSCTLAVTTIAISPLNALFAQAAYPASPIIIGEIAWAGSSLSDADEWVELWNLSDATIDIGGWSLHYAGESGKIIYLSPDSVVPAFGTFLIANYDSTYAKSALDITPQTVTTTVSLSNSTLKIELYDNLGNRVDVAGTGSVPLAGASQTIKTSMLRQDPTLDGALVSSWKNSTEKQNLKTNVGDLATPGFCDGCAAYIPTVEPTPIVDPEAGAASTSTDVVTASNDDSATSTGNLPDPTIQDAASSTDVVSTSTDDTVMPITDDLMVPGSTTTESLATSSTEPADVSPQAPDTGVQMSSSSVASPVVSAPQTPAPQPKPNYAMLRLSEIMPYPASGKEWVEIVTLDAANKISLSGCELHDAQGRIMAFGSRTIDPTSNRFLKIELSTARLNNSGDSVSLYSPTGQLLDTVSFPALKKGQTWIRYPDMAGGWQKTDIASPSAGNIQSQTAVASTTQAAGADTQISTSISTAIETANPQTSVATTSTADETGDQDWVNGLKGEDDSGRSMSDLIASLSSDDETLPKDEPVSKIVKTVAKKTTVKKTKTSTAKTEPIIPFTFAMLNQIEDTPLRVRLAGAVGSTPGLLPNHSFILQSPEGRGLLVKVPTNRRLPVFGDDVSVVGKLYVDDKGVPYVKMAAKDPLETQGSSTASVPRLVDLTAPSIEDTWALMSVTGTVKSVKGRTVLLDLGDAELSVTIRQSVKYRPQRLLTGDVVRVSGLLDTTREPAVLLPRKADDIILVEHAKTISAAASKSPTGMEVPGWTPIGAAAGAVAMTEGAKHLHRRRKQKLLEDKLKQLITTEVL